MKAKLIILSLFLMKSVNAQLDMKVERLEKMRDGELVRYRKMTVKGTYNGKDIFIKNSFGGNGIGFCVSQVNVNKNITTDEINDGVFRVNLELHKLKLGEK